MKAQRARKRGTLKKAPKIKATPEATSKQITRAIETNLRRYERRQADRRDRTDVTAYRRVVKQ